MAIYVLVHGAYQGGWIWKPVAERLRAAGHRVIAPTLDGCGHRHDQVRPGITVATHGQEIAKLLFYEDLDRVMLVGRNDNLTGGDDTIPNILLVRSGRSRACASPLCLTSTAT